MKRLRRTIRPVEHLPASPGAGRAALWWMLGAAFAVVAAIALTTPWLLYEAGKASTPTDRAKARIDAVRTGLAAGAGMGAAAGLLLAFRRQQHHEVAVALSDQDATEKRLAELYTKAADQLGNPQAAVRLAGLYALERVGQNNPGMRQTIVDVICAYLRMPYTPPTSTFPRTAAIRAHRSYQASKSGRTGQPVGPAGDPHGEQQVRLTAQRILAEHIRDDTDPRFADRRHWQNMRIDLSNATLIDLDIRRCRMNDARFTGATFTGDARFDDATFSGDIQFDDATFSGKASFRGADFGSKVSFANADFCDVEFAAATFNGWAEFHNANFNRTTVFSDAIFASFAMFNDATFSGTATFYRARFDSLTMFSPATFSKIVVFDEATFSSSASFNNATLRRASFVKVTFGGDVSFGGSIFSDLAFFAFATFNGDAAFNRATFSGSTHFGGATFAKGAEKIGYRDVSISPNTSYVWPNDWQVDRSGVLQYTDPSALIDPS